MICFTIRMCAATPVGPGVVRVYGFPEDVTMSWRGQVRPAVAHAEGPGKRARGQPVRL